MTRYTAEFLAALKRREPWALKQREKNEAYWSGRNRRASSLERENLRLFGPVYCDPSNYRNAAEEAKQREKENAEKAKHEAEQAKKEQEKAEQKGKEEEK